MELINATNMPAAYTQGMDKSGRESLVVVVKGTFTLPLDGSLPSLLEQQAPLVEADVYLQEPGLSACLCESDFAPFKPRCDVLLNGSAYAPNGQPVKELDTRLRVANIDKTLHVVGNRLWYADAGSIGKTFAEPFNVMPLHYGRAFGGLDDFHHDENKRDAYMDNPIGRGFHRHLQDKLVHHTPLPNIEEPGHPVKKPDGQYRPMAYGVVGRSWPQRARYAGTYDQNWVDTVFPFLPDDFNEAYFQAAPTDQQCPYLQGGEWVELHNLTPTGLTRFQLPSIAVPVVFFKKRDEDHHTQAVIDTLLIEPDLGRFSLVWRVSEPLKRNMFEIPQVLVGRMSKAWWRARTLGKTYYPGLNKIGSTEAEHE
ncbi:DUF2169 domain-containing protein [Bowmanella denitrificans]|uniref:DUF2169 domain-containing protein n=1 Tax=Bowmanella denitrificans TaxID=366582 RepID=A0ABN0XAD3_9ALTE